MTRTTHRLLAWIGIVGIACAQVAVAAHACTLGAAVRSTSEPQLHQGHCAGVVGDDTPLAHPANTCEVHCTDGANTSSIAPDLPPFVGPSVAVQLWPVAMAIDRREWDRSVLAAKSAAPPPFLQYGRLLN